MFKKPNSRGDEASPALLVLEVRGSISPARGQQLNSKMLCGAYGGFL